MWLRGKKIEQGKKTIEGKQSRVYIGIKIKDNENDIQSSNPLDD